MDSQIAILLALLIAVAPAAFTFWSDRRLTREVDDPALPERLVARRSRNAVAAGIAVGLLGVAFPRHFLWAMPVLVLSRMIAAYPMRRAVFAETWSLAAYLSFFVRLIAAVPGFFLAVALMPAVVQLGGRFDWIVAAAAAVALGVWNAKYPQTVRALLRAEPIGDRDLLARCAQMAEQCGLPAVWIERVPLRGGVFANAVALPSLSAPGVLVSDTLLAAMTRDEAFAIVAHELAHLEHYNAPRLRRLRAFHFLLVAAVAIAVPAARRLSPTLAPYTAAAGIIAVMVALAVRAGRRQQHETASDLRAVALTGNAEALIGALTKLHAIARIPRRWRTEHERQATHPSLARRIQAIREAAGANAAPLATSVVFASAPPGLTAITFGPDHLAWQDGPSASHRFAYDHLVELRVDARTSGAPTLVAVDPSGRRWQTALDPGDVARVQAVLDAVDHRLAKPRAATPSAPAVKLVTAFTAVVALMFGQIAAAIVVVLAAIDSSAPVMAAAGASLMVAAGLVWRDQRSAAAYGPWAPAALVATAVVLFAVARLRRRVAADRRSVPVLAVMCTLAAFPVAAAGIDSVALHQAARAFPAAAVLALALATALAVARGRGRYASAVPAVFAAAFLFIGSMTFLERVSGDPFLAASPPMDVRVVTSTPIAEFAASGDTIGLAISPSGSHVLLDGEAAEESTYYEIGRSSGPLRRVDADAALFVGDNRVLLLDSREGGARLRLVDSDDPARVSWVTVIPDMVAARLSVDAVGGFRMLGRAARGDVVEARGAIGHEEVSEARWPLHSGRYASPLAVDAGAVLVFETEYRRGILDSTSFNSWAPLLHPTPRTVSHLEWLDGSTRTEVATSRLALTCDPPPSGGREAVCFAFDGVRTRFFLIERNRLAPLATMSGRFYGRVAGAWVSGWLENRPALVDPEKRRAWTARAAPGEHIMALAAGEHVIATLSSAVDAPIVRVYRMPR